MDIYTNPTFPLFGEKFKEIEFDQGLQQKYAISNFGRLLSFKDEMKDGKILKGSMTDGFRIIRYKKRIYKEQFSRHKLIYKLVVEAFMPQKPGTEHVIHLDYNLSNDQVSNLKWVTNEERMAHLKENPKVKKAKQELWEFNQFRDGQKLTVTNVMLIKKMLARPDRKNTYKKIAQQFGISDMQLYRIRTGENWSQVVI